MRTSRVLGILPRAMIEWAEAAFAACVCQYWQRLLKDMASDIMSCCDTVQYTGAPNPPVECISSSSRSLYGSIATLLIDLNSEPSNGHPSRGSYKSTTKPIRPCHLPTTNTFLVSPSRRPGDRSPCIRNHLAVRDHPSALCSYIAWPAFLAAVAPKPSAVAMAMPASERAMSAAC